MCIGKVHTCLMLLDSYYFYDTSGEEATLPVSPFL